MPSLWQDLAILIALAAHSLTVVIYRTYFHPLSRFPGPILAAATKWYYSTMILLNGLMEHSMYEIERMHDVYGRRL